VGFHQRKPFESWAETLHTQSQLIYKWSEVKLCKYSKSFIKASDANAVFNEAKTIIKNWQNQWYESSSFLQSANISKPIWHYIGYVYMNNNIYVLCIVQSGMDYQGYIKHYSTISKRGINDGDGQNIFTMYTNPNSYTHDSSLCCFIRECSSHKVCEYCICTYV
jgi:hypothetical protein